MKAQIHSSLVGRGITSFYVACISFSIFRGTLCFRAFLSQDRLRGEKLAKWKFPGGDARAYERPEDAAWREWREEVLRPGSKVNFDANKAVLVHEVVLDRDDNFPGGKHAKFFYLFNEHDLDQYKGDMHFRTSLTYEEKEKDTNGKPDKTKGEGILYPSFPMDVETLGPFLKQTRSWYHRSAFAMAIRHLARSSREIAELIPRDLRDWAETENHLDRS